MGSYEGGEIIQAVQREKENRPDPAALQAWGDDLWLRNENIPKDSHELLEQLQKDRELLEDNFDVLDFDQDGNINIEEIADLKLTGELPKGGEGPNFSPEELISIERLFFNPKLRGNDEKAGLSLEDVDKEIASKQKEIARTDAKADPPAEEAKAKPTPATPTKAEDPKPAPATPTKAEDPKPTPATPTEAEDPKPTPATPTKAEDPKPTPATPTKAEDPKPAPATPPKAEDPKPTPATPTKAEDPKPTPATPTKAEDPKPTPATPTKAEDPKPTPATPTKAEDPKPTPATPTKAEDPKPTPATPTKAEDPKPTPATPTKAEDPKPTPATPTKAEDPKPTPAVVPPEPPAPEPPGAAPVAEPPGPAPVAEAPVAEPPTPEPPGRPGGAAPTVPGQESVVDYGYTKLSFVTNSQTHELNLVKEGDSVWEKRADNKWYDQKANAVIPGQLSLLADGSLKQDIKEGVYRIVSPLKDGYSRKTIHRSNDTEVSAVYKAGEKEPSQMIEYPSANPTQQTIWQRDENNPRIWKNGNQVRYDLTLQSNGNLTYSVNWPQLGQYQGRVISNNGTELAQGLDALGQDGVPRYTFDNWGRITSKEYAGGNRQNCFSFVYKPDGSSEAIGMTYQERRWNDQTHQHETYKTMAYNQISGDQWQLTTNNTVSGSLYFKPLLSTDGRVGTLHFENGFWVQSDHDMMTRTYLTDNTTPQYQPTYYYPQTYQPTYAPSCQPSRRGLFRGLFRRS